MRHAFVVLGLFLCSLAPATAQVSIGIGLPNVSIGINLPVYPQLVAVPGYPVYYAPQVNGNYFFYDGMYWVYQNDNWYASSWYNGPWGLVAPDYVPLYVLRVPVRYYRAPPVYFRGWYANSPPRWNQHWGNQWAQSHSGWDRWDRNSAPRAAPLPVYQRQYSGNRYPHVEQQVTIQSENYRYQPRDTVVRQAYQTQGVRVAPAPTTRAAQPNPPPQRTAQPQDYNRGGPPPQDVNRSDRPPSQGTAPSDMARGGTRPPPQTNAPSTAMPAPASPQPRQPAHAGPPRGGSPGNQSSGGPPPQGRQQSMQAPPPQAGAPMPSRQQHAGGPPQQQQQQASAPPQQGGGAQEKGRGGPPPDKGGGKGDERGK